ncbi:uncharacterized protein LTR77_006917 [Saxophila tyrrhenica]|uniref:Myb-like domain-containing protein n=1 Tax=Saxophila tyrrhenica TaxID=1690608 RepID=A0AAV9P6A5_9PEZI|nr:hypothetical protein LTR77_006917 [Saxophila tyrrhenica]
MGRLARDIAAVAVNANNLPEKDQLPEISLWDAFLPGRGGSPKTQKKTKPYPAILHHPHAPNMLSLKLSGRPLIAIAPYDADQYKPVEPMTLIEQREYTMPSAKRLYNGKMALVVRKHADDGEGASDAKGAEKAKGGGEGGKKGASDGKKGGDDAKKGDGKKGEKQEGGGKGKAEKKEGGGEKGEGGDGKNDQGEEFTEEQDKTILAMKADGKSWAEIGAAIGRSKSTTTSRWKELTKAGGGGDQGKGEAKNDKAKADGGDKGNDKKGDKKGDKKAGGDQKPSVSKAPSSKAGSDARFTKGEWTTLMEDDMFSFGELQCISELLVQDERHRWLRVASRFADKTGRKVHPDDIRDKFVEMGRMRG